MKIDELSTSLKSHYATVLSKINFEQFAPDEDHYSGVFLSKASDSYFASKTKVMLIGRETAGWNTNNNCGTMNRLRKFCENDKVDNVVNESLTRYSRHLDSLVSNVDKPQRSHFRRFHNQISKHYGIAPDALIYSNLLAWDYKKSSPLKRPISERNEIISTSIKLLSAQINAYQPDTIIFATGYSVDKIIKKLFAEEFDGCQTHHVLPKKLWQFSAAGAKCFRIAHPRAMSNGHPEVRQHLLNLL